MTDTDSQLIEIDRLKQQVKIIKAYIEKYADLHLTVVSILEQVEGGKEFREAFDDNVEKIVKNIISNSSNLKSLQAISNEQIKTYLNGSDFQKELKMFVIESVENEVNNNKSDINVTIKDIVNGNINERERKMLIKVMAWTLGSITTILTFYKMVFV